MISVVEFAVRFGFGLMRILTMIVLTQVNPGKSGLSEMMWVWLGCVNGVRLQ